MVTVDNFASKLCSLIIEKNPEDNVREWRLLGQEQDGTLLFSWIQQSKIDNSHTKIGTYNYSTNTLKTIFIFSNITNCIQASIDNTKNYLLYIIKETHNNENDDNKGQLYRSFFYKINQQKTNKLPIQLLEKNHQIMGQFLYRKQSVLNEDLTIKFLLLIHQECIQQYQYKLSTNVDDIDIIDNFNIEYLTNIFTWAQWDPIHQTLYYIHNRKPSKGLVEGEEPLIIGTKSSSTLTGLQFHDDLPHESVLNIPLNLPHLTPIPSHYGIYEDDTVPLRSHDSSLDLIVLTNSKGFVCICHHYLYQPIQETINLEENDNSLIHFAYSVTVLHQSCVIHCVIPGLPWSKAKTIKPIFRFHDEHIMVFIPEVCTHLLDVGTMHESYCHITIKPILSEKSYFTSLLTLGDDYIVDLTNLDLIKMTIPIKFFIEMFKNDKNLNNKLAIIHYLIVHKGDFDTVSDLICWQAEKPLTLGLTQILREFLIGSSYYSVYRNLPSDAGHLIVLLPITTQHIGFEMEVKCNDYLICLSQEVLWNASMMLLSPQQRVIPYRTDIWVKLWEQLAKILKGKQRFKPSQVVEKLLISLVCYQPEALSRSSTPMSPSGSFGSSSVVLNDFLSINSQSRKSQSDMLPFFEIESCTASKQEHIISVNLRELSMHLLKQNSENKISRFHWQSQTPMHVHAVATRYITSQLEQSRFLCQILCKAANYDPRQELEKGFVYIEQLQIERRHILFTILERYYLSVESIAFPLPQGFTSFFAYLGYKTLDFDTFLQYIHRNVLELQVDVMKIIMADIDNSRQGVNQKLKLLTLLPRSRAKRLLNQWHHPVSLMLRAREHALNILSGVEVGTNRSTYNKCKNFTGITAFPTGNRLSPLDTFLDLLTAKANLTELDFGLLIEATDTSTEEFI